MLAIDGDTNSGAENLNKTKNHLNAIYFLFTIKYYAI